jgi:hypothetical protein
VRHLDGCEFNTACETLTGEPPPGRKKKSNGAAKPFPDFNHPVAFFDYHDAAGNVVYRNVRFPLISADGAPVLSETGKPDKTFFLQHPHEGGWEYGIKRWGITQIPYRLPDLNKALAQGAMIFIPEGESKVDLLVSWGLAATWIAEGTEPKDFAELFRGSNVILMPDADAAGDGHVERIGGALYGIANRLRLLRLPGPAKSDIKDWAAAGGTVEQLRELTESAPEWSPPAPVVDSAKDAELTEGVLLDDFHACMETHTYIFTPTRARWPAVSVNARIPAQPLLDADGEPVFDAKGNPMLIKASTWLDQNKPIEQRTWAPGLPMVIRDRLISIDGGWVERKGTATFNLYRPPTIMHGDSTRAGRWLDHVKRVFPDEADHIIMWLAHRVQRPQEKINHALVFGGEQGIGKDSILEPVKAAVGPWNFAEISPQQAVGRFNSFLKSVILRVSEGRDLGEVDRFAFYEHMKTYTAAPPDVLRIDEKHLREHGVLNCCGVVITTNYRDGIFLPVGDRRHFVAWSKLATEDFEEGYWDGLHKWYQDGGSCDVAAYLATLDISAFKPKAPPLKTPAFYTVVEFGRNPEDAEMADVLDDLGNPEAVTLLRIIAHAGEEFAAWLIDRKNRRVVGHRLEKCGYLPVRNPDAKDGLWRLNSRRQAIYGRSALSNSERLLAAKWLAHGERPGR